jgi:hypothetical protein
MMRSAVYANYSHQKKSREISALVIQMLKTTKLAHQEGYLKCDVFDGKTMDINYRFIYD